MRDFCTGGEIAALTAEGLSHELIGRRIDEMNNTADEAQKIGYHYRRDSRNRIIGIQVHYAKLSPEWKAYLQQRAPFKSLLGPDSA